MTGYNINLKQADLVALFKENDAMAALIHRYSIAISAVNKPLFMPLWRCICRAFLRARSLK